MKAILFVIAMTLSLSAGAQSFDVPEPLTERLIAMLTSVDSGFNTGSVEGAKNYGAQLECSNEVGDLEPESMKCFVRSLAGFSVIQQTPIQVAGLLATELKELLISRSMKYMITNDFNGIGSTITCTDNSAVVIGGAAPRNRCKVGRLF